MQATQQAPAKPDKASMEIYVIIAFALIVIVGGVIFYNGMNEPEPVAVTPQPIVQPAVPAAPIAEPKPLPEVEVDKSPVIAVPTPVAQQQPAPNEAVAKEEQAPPLPSLDDSDKLTLDNVSELSWLPNYVSLLVPQDMLRNFVVFIDNLSRGDLATKFAPLQRPKQGFSARESDGKIYIDEASYKRYTPYIDIVNSLNIELALEQYQKLMPLIDQAYMELGYEQGAFNQTLITAIETMLAAPTIREPIELLAPSVMYQFKDPALEQLPAAQKLMLRIGPDNTTQLRPKLQQIHISLSEL